MNYALSEVPMVSKAYSHQNDMVNGRVICSSSGEIKILNCDPGVLNEVLQNTNGKLTFGEIEEVFAERFAVHEVRNFLSVLLGEGVIEKSPTERKVKKTPLFLVIGEGALADAFENCKRVTCADFLKNGFNHGFDAVILAPSVCTYSEMVKLNEKIYRHKKPLVSVGFNGSEIMAGPLIVPGKTACLECIASWELKLLNAKSSSAKVSLDDIGDVNYLSKIPKEVESPVVKRISDVLIDDMSRFIEGLPSKFLDTQLFFAPDDLSLLSHTKKYRLPTTYCGFCEAFNKNYVRLESDSGLIEDFAQNSDELVKRKVQYSVGGLRSKTESETKAVLEAQLSKIGAKVITAPNNGNPFSKSGFVSCYSAHVEQGGNSEMPYLYRRSVGAGKGITPAQAYFSMAFELIEHIGLQYTGEIPIYCAKYKDVSNIAIDMPRLANTIMNKHTAYDNFDEDCEVDWVVATSLTGGGKKLVPAFLAFMNDVELKCNLFTATSSGAAAGLTIEDAILHGLFEAIERDAWLIGQCNPYVLPIVDYANVTNVKVKEFVSKANEMGYDVITRDYTNDLTIPVYRTWIVNRNNFSTYAYTGFGCHVSPEIALERSITEASQTNDRSDYGGDIAAGMITPFVMITSMVNLNNQHHLVNKDILGKTDKVTTIGEPIFQMTSSYDVIKNVCALVKEKVGGDVYYIDLTRPGMDVKLVKVVALGGDFQAMNFPIISASKRMFEFGIRCGYSDRKTTYAELFLGSYQH